MGTQAQDAVFWPSLAVNLRLRLDSAYNSAGTDPPAIEIDTLAASPTPVVPASGAAGSGVGGAIAGAASLGQGLLHSLVAAAQTQPEPLRPQALQGTADKLSRLLTIVPKTASVELPGYRQAGKWSMTLLYRDLPLDPRMVRALGVEFYLGTVSASDFQQGLSEQLPPGKARKSVIPTTTAAGLMNKNNLLIIGVADSIKVDHGSGGNLIHIEGRDLRGVLLDAKLRPDQLANVDLSNDIVQVVTDIVALHPLMGSVNVVGQESDWPNSQIPSPGVAGDLTKVNTVMTTAASSSGGSAGNGRARAGGGAGQDWTMWDAITKYCYIVGAIPFFQGEDLWIRPAYGLYEYQTNPNHYPNVPVPFAGGRSRQALPHPNYRCMVYGRNILSLKLDRKLGGVKTPCVEVVCTDTSSTTRGKGRLLVERWPDTPPATSVEPSGDASHLDVMRVPVHGINNPTRLKEIAHQIFEEVARGEITGSIETKDLSSFAGNNDDADLLRLRPGDPIEIVVNADNPLDEYPVVNDVSAWEVSQSQQVKMLTDKLGDKDLAQAIVDTRSGKVADLQRTFRVNAVKFGWEAGSGVAVDFDFHNYIETRFDQSQTAPATTTATQQTAPGGSAASMRRIAMAAFGDSPSAKRIASAAFGPSPSGAPSLPDPTEATTPNPKGTT